MLLENHPNKTNAIKPAIKNENVVLIFIQAIINRMVNISTASLIKAGMSIINTTMIAMIYKNSVI